MFVSFKKIRIYIIFSILLVLLKNISIVYYNMKMQNVYIYIFNESQNQTLIVFQEKNQNFIQTRLVIYTYQHNKRADKRARSSHINASI